jgi:hypothetical protein
VLVPVGAVVAVFVGGDVGVNVETFVGVFVGVLVCVEGIGVLVGGGA